MAGGQPEPVRPVLSDLGREDACGRLLLEPFARVPLGDARALRELGRRHRPGLGERTVQTEPAPRWIERMAKYRQRGPEQLLRERVSLHVVCHLVPRYGASAKASRLIRANSGLGKLSWAGRLREPAVILARELELSDPRRPATRQQDDQHDQRRASHAARLAAHRVARPAERGPVPSAPACPPSGLRAARVTERRAEIDLQRHGAAVPEPREILEERIEVQHARPGGRCESHPFPALSDRCTCRTRSPNSCRTSIGSCFATAACEVSSTTWCIAAIASRSWFAGRT